MVPLIVTLLAEEIEVNNLEVELGCAVTHTPTSEAYPSRERACVPEIRDVERPHRATLT